MLKMLLTTLIVIVAAILILASRKPSDFSITRNAVFSAPASAVFEQVNNFHNWEKWSPWAKMDPSVKNNYEGPSSGNGAVLSWTGNNQVGEGRMTITESRPSDLIKIKLEFFKPFVATNATVFTFLPEGEQTRVTWTMSGKNNFMAKIMSLFMNCDKMVGDQFEKGLANLRAVTS